MTSGFRERIIRPEEMRDYCTRLMNCDIQRLMKQPLTNHSCPLCGANSHTPVFRKGRFAYVHCIACDLLYVRNRPARKALAAYYNESEGIRYWNQQIYPLVEQGRMKHLYAPRAAYIMKLTKQYLPAATTVIELGAGQGAVCRMLKQSGLYRRVIGVDFSTARSRTMRESGIEHYTQNLEKIEFAFKADLICAFEVVEHLYSLRDTLLRIRRHLKRNGMIVLSTPNYRGFEMTVLGKHSDSYYAPTHLNYFSPAAMSRYLHDAGFRIVDMSTPGELDVEICRKWLRRNSSKKVSKGWRQAIARMDETAGRDVQQFLRENMLSSHLRVAAVKTI